MTRQKIRPVTRQKIRPVEGLKVPNPSTGAPLAASGEVVVLNAYWRRRIAAGEVMSVPAKPAKKEG